MRWERYELHFSIKPVTAMIDQARHLATVKTKDREIVLQDIPVGESPYNPSGLPWRKAVSPSWPGGWSGSAAR